MLRSALLFSLLAPMLAAQGDEPPAGQNPEKDLWLEDFAAARAKAKAEQKDLLVDFTGSDWCGWCQRLDAEVFATDEFQNAAPERFVLVKLDYPQDETLVTPEIKAQNAKLQREYSIQGFPTILLMDPDGRVFAQTGYQEGGPVPYNTMLDELQQGGSAFKNAIAEAAQQQGLERARSLDRALATLDEPIRQYHFATMQEIVNLDDDGAAGLKAKYAADVERIAAARKLGEAIEEINALIGEHMQNDEGDAAIAKLDAFVEKAKGDAMRHQLGLYFKGMVLMDARNDAKAAVAALEVALALAPDSSVGKQIARVLPQIREAVPAGGDGK